MTGVRFAKGAAAFLALIAAGFFLGTYLDRRFTSDEAGYQVTSNDRPTASACVGEDGAWKNWLWPHVLALSPKCTEQR